MSHKIGSDLDELRNNLKIDITSLLFASKDGLAEKDLMREYSSLKGKSIPFRTIGFVTLFDFMKDPFMKSSVRIERRGPTWVYFGIHSEATKSLGEMVKNQNNLSKQRRQRNYRGNYLQGWDQYNSGPLRSAKLTIPAHILKSIEEVLRLEDDFKMSNEKFQLEYLKKTGFHFNFSEYGYESLRVLLQSLPHLVRLTPEADNVFNIQLVLNNSEGQSFKNLKVFCVSYALILI